MSFSRIRRAARATVVIGSTDVASGDMTSRIRRVMGTSRAVRPMCSGRRVARTGGRKPATGRRPRVGSAPAVAGREWNNQWW
ncbi:hypothetical protein GCM10027074_64290 [Streptomyces deserti]